MSEMLPKTISNISKCYQKQLVIYLKYYQKHSLEVTTYNTSYLSEKVQFNSEKPFKKPRNSQINILKNCVLFDNNNGTYCIAYIS